jgi:predicted amidohydrolase
VTGSLKLALVQPDTTWESPAGNLEKAAGLIARASAQGAEVAALPEMFTTGFSMNAHSIEGAEARIALSSMAKENNINIIAGVAAPVDVKGLNKALAFDTSGALIAEYAKMHPFSYAGEEKHYTPGQGPVTFDLAGAPSSVFICYDLRFPEIFRSVARDVKVIYLLANWPASRQEHWHALLRARAIENQCYVAGVNRVGADGGGIEYVGGSCVHGPFGEEFLVAGKKEGVSVVDLDIASVESIRSQYPFLNDMRTPDPNTLG